MVPGAAPGRSALAEPMSGGGDKKRIFPPDAADCNPDLQQLVSAQIEAMKQIIAQSTAQMMDLLAQHLLDAAAGVQWQAAASATAAKVDAMKPMAAASSSAYIEDPHGISGGDSDQFTGCGMQTANNSVSSEGSPKKFVKRAPDSLVREADRARVLAERDVMTSNVLNKVEEHHQPNSCFKGRTKTHSSSASMEEAEFSGIVPYVGDYKTQDFQNMPDGSEDSELDPGAREAAKAHRLSQQSSRNSVSSNSQQLGAVNEATKKLKQHKAVFADASEMKEKIRQTVSTKAYNVADFYHKTGVAQAVARSSIFENVTLGVILFNAVWIAVDTDFNLADFLLDADPPFIVAENFFCAYFSMEWLTRFCAFRRKRDGLQDFWFVFDSALAGLMVLETWVMTSIMYASKSSSSGTPFDPAVLKLFRLMRLSRMMRMARLLRAMPELMILIKGMAVAMRSVVFTLSLLMIIMYVFAIAIRQLTRDTDSGDMYFSSVPTSMFSLLMNAILPDQNTMVYYCANDESTSFLNRGIYVILMLVFILLGSLTVMNMLVGVLVEVVSVVSSVEKESLVVNFVKAQLHSLMCDELDADSEGKISKTDFAKLLMNKFAAQILGEVGVDVVGLVDFQDHIFKDTDDITFADFMEVVLQLRGTNNATVRDIVDLRKFVSEQINTMEKRMSARMSLENGIGEPFALSSIAIPGCAHILQADPSEGEHLEPVEPLMNVAAQPQGPICAADVNPQAQDTQEEEPRGEAARFTVGVDGKMQSI